MAETRTPPKAPAAIAAAVLLSVPLTSAFEGLRTKPYRDPAGIPTVCFGETQVAMQKYTKQQCVSMLTERQVNDYAPAVLKCVPGLAAHTEIFAASADAAYNAGVGAFCRSPMAAMFKSGHWRAGCQAFRNWRVTANGKRLAGLVRRREAERTLCLDGLA